jgi:hypothetical protein
MRCATGPAGLGVGGAGGGGGLAAGGLGVGGSAGVDTGDADAEFGTGSHGHRNLRPSTSPPMLRAAIMEDFGFARKW